MIENWLKTTKERGLDGEKLLDAARAAIKKHESAPDLSDPLRRQAQATFADARRKTGRRPVRPA